MRVTNSFRTGETKLWTTNVYDESRRAKQVTLPDVEFYYDGKYLDANDYLQTATGSVKGKTTGMKSSVSRTNYTAFNNLKLILFFGEFKNWKINADLAAKRFSNCVA